VRRERASFPLNGIVSRSCGDAHATEFQIPVGSRDRGRTFPEPRYRSRAGAATADTPLTAKPKEAEEKSAANVAELSTMQVSKTRCARCQ